MRDENKTILVVDDDWLIRALCMDMLRHLGFEVIDADGGRTAVELFKQHANDLLVVILDLDMPDMGGRATFRELSALNSQVPVLIASGFSEGEVIAHFEGLPIAGYIPKPFQVGTITSKLKCLERGGTDGGT